MIKADFHVHSEFSNDSETKIELQVQKAIEKGFEFICFTDHYDMDYPTHEEEPKFKLHTEKYYKKIQDLKEEYSNKIEILFGVELGLMPYLKERIGAYVNKFSFDFIIGSSHLVNGKDPCLKSFFENRSEKESYIEYFESTLENVKVFTEYNVYGHLDYVVRYGPNKNKFFNFNDYKDIFEQILKIIIQNGKGIEINTAGLANGLGYPHPHKEILKMYKNLGGKVITIASDAHVPNRLGYKFNIAEEILKDIGFEYYSVFKNQSIKFYKL